MLAAIIVSAGLGPSAATDFQVRMLDQGTSGTVQFDPRLLKIAPGDTVRFIATDQGHNVQSVDGMIPAGAKPFPGASSSARPLRPLR